MPDIRNGGHTMMPRALLGNKEKRIVAFSCSSCFHDRAWEYAKTGRLKCARCGVEV